MNKRSDQFQSGPFFILVAINLVIGFVASLFTRPEIAGWYAALHKPWFNPPSWLFAPVWTIIYILIAIAAYQVWKHRDNTAAYKTTVAIYFIQLLLNFSWSIAFFGLHQVFGALIVILALLASIILNMVWFGRFSRTGAWLLLPYLLWVGFASVLNLNIYLLNR
jgi:benzodiazapine receptor